MKTFILIASCLVLASARRLSKLPITYTPRARGGGRIINGVDADVGEFPHQIILKHHGSLMCGGSLVAPDRVITAGHCCDGQSASSLSVTVGEYDRRHDDGTEVDIKVDKVVPNENYSPWELTNDICLLYLAEAAEFNDAVGAIGLPESMQEYDEGTDCTVIGWGTTEQGSLSQILQKVVVPVVSDETCNADYNPEGMEVADSMICAGLDEGGKDSCQGDSGGAFMCHASGAPHELSGIVSWGIGCAEPGYPGVYTQTSYFIDWINNNM